jgi:hypothetical protein
MDSDMDNKLDPFTFGDSKACVNLADMLSKLNDARLTARVSKTICHYSLLFNQINRMNDTRAKASILNLIRSSIENDKLIASFPERIKTHTLNVVIGKCKISLRKVQAEHLLNKIERRCISMMKELR